MSTDKLWRPGTEVPEQYGTKALLALIVLAPNGGRRVLMLDGTFVWSRAGLGTAAPSWRGTQWQCRDEFTPASTFVWLQVDALTDILIAEYDIEAL